MDRGITLRTCLASLAVLAAMPVSAGMVTLDFDIRFGEVAPTGGAPWLQAVFDDDTGDASTVSLSITALGSLGAADVTELYFNLNPALDPTTLNITFNSITGGATPAIGAILPATGIDAFMADGDGIYDIRLDLPPPPGDNSLLFNAGETLVLDIERTGGGSLTAADFYYLSAPGPGEDNPGPFLAAAHLQSTGADLMGSDWVAAVPIPAAIWLFASSLGMLGFATRRRRRSVAMA